jgi:hypothetical protein
MPKLTKKQERTLQRTGDLVRMYIAVLTVVMPLLCVWNALDEYRAVEAVGGIPEIPRASTYGTITGIYLPLFLASGAYIWAVAAGKTWPLAPRGYRMALFRDGFTVLVTTVILAIPVLLYIDKGSSIKDVNPILVWYQSIMATLAGGTFTYYFNAAIEVRKAQHTQPADTHAGRTSRTELAVEKPV